MCVHRLLVSHEHKREVRGVEAEPASDVVMDYRGEYEQNALKAAKELMAALEGAIRHGADPAVTRQLRTQLGRWLKKSRSGCK